MRAIALLHRHMAITLVCLLAIGGASAWAFWTGNTTAEPGSGAAGAASVNPGATPTAQQTSAGSDVAVTWGDSTLTNGVAAGGYLVRRYADGGSTPETIGAGCSGVRQGTSCTESGLPTSGRWQYTVTPVIGTNWAGEESLKSGAVDTGPGTLTLDHTLFGGTVDPAPYVVSGTVSGFDVSAPLTYTLDTGTAITGAPGTVGADGSAAISLTIPTATADGPHTVIVTSAGKSATIGILVDTTAPTMTVETDPVANGAGWNNTPVMVIGTPNDGPGSGAAFVSYTEDGSDPKTSPTTQTTTVPVAVTHSETARFFVTDRAGNESVVMTKEIKIDVAPPMFLVDFVDIQGGAYGGATNVITGQPGTAYYRGIAAGSLRFLMTPVPNVGASPVVAASFSELRPGTTGFTFDSSTVTTPEGGPYLSNPLSWVAGTTSVPDGAIYLTNAAGSSLGGPGEMLNDSEPPTGGSVDATGLVGADGRYSTTRALSLHLAAGADSGSGLADGTGPVDEPARLQRAAATLNTSDGVAAGLCGTYGGYTQIGAVSPPATVDDTVPDDAACYRYQYLVADHVGNVASYTSPDIKVQSAAAPGLRPTDAVITAVSGVSAQATTGTTVYYNPAQLGSFTVDTSVSSPISGVSSVTFPVIDGFTGGGVVTSPLSGTTFRTTYAWNGNGASPSPGVQEISAINHAGNMATNASAFSVVKDVTGPTGGGLGAVAGVGTGGQYGNVLTGSGTFSAGTDAGSGLAPSGFVLLRASASLTSDGTSDGVCGTYGSYAMVATDPVSPHSSTMPVDRTCYRYAYVVADRVGNPTTYVGADLKIDTVPPPAPTLSFSSLSNVSWSGTGTMLYYRSAAASGSFRVTGTSLDTTAGIASWSLPALPSGWTASSPAAGAKTYSWTASNPTAPPGAQNVTVTNNATSTATTGFTVTPDNSAPTGGAVDYTNGYTSASTVSLSLSKGTDTGAGVDAASGLLQEATATLSGGACGTFGSFATATANPAASLSVPISTNRCYRYRYLVSDLLGSQATYTNANTVKSDRTAPVNAFTIASPVAAFATGSTIYWRSNVAGSFKVVDTVTDTGSGPASTTFPAIAASGWVHGAETVTTPAGGPFTSATFSWSANATAPASPFSVNSVDAAGVSSTTGEVNFVADRTSPTDGSITYPSGIINEPSVAIATNNGEDAGAGVDPTTAMIRRDVATLNATTGQCGSFPGTFATVVTLVGGADTSVIAGRCYRYRSYISDRVGNQATYTSASTVIFDVSGPRITAIASRQSSGSVGNGRLEVGDRLVLTFNQSIAPASVPPTFTGASESSAFVFATVTLSIPGFTQGEISTGSSGYVGWFGQATFAGTAVLTGSGATTTITLTVTSLGGSGTSASSGALRFLPADSITDLGGNPATTTFTTSSNFKLF